MNIIVVHNRYRKLGGEDRVYEQEVALLRDHGHEVAVFERSNNDVAELTPPQKALLPFRLIRSLSATRSLAELVRREAPDVVHVHNTHFMISPAVFPSIRRLGVPLVHTLHNYRPLCANALLFRRGQPCEDCLHGTGWPGIRHGCYRASRVQSAALVVATAVHRRRGTLVNNVDRFIALTEFARQKFIEGGFPANMICVKPNFVYPDPGPASGPRDQLLFLGRFTRQKGVLTLLQALRQSPESSVTLMGKGDLVVRIRSAIADYPLPAVTVKEWGTTVQVHRELRRSRAVVVPSESYEGFPMTVAEAFAFGVPVIASNIGGLPEIVEHERTGLLFEPGNTVELASRIRHAWQHPERMAALGREARRKFETTYAAGPAHEGLIAIYRQAKSAALGVSFR